MNETNILEWIDTNLQSAIIEKNTVKVNLFREIKTGVKNFMVENKISTITKNDFNVVLKRILKVLNEEIDLFSKVTNIDANKLHNLNVSKEMVESFLPKPMTQEDMQVICEKIVLENPGQNIGFYMSKVKDIEGIDKGFCSQFFKNINK